MFQREVKVKKSVKKEQTTIEERNGNQNGDLDAELTVKLPTKKPGAQIETKVAVENKILPDGSIEEVKTITTKTTIDGKTEINTKTESRILSEEEAEAAIEEVEEEEVEEEEEEQEDTSQEITDKKENQLVTKQVNNVNTTTTNANAQDKNIIKTEEKSETIVTTTKKVVVVQSDNEETEEVEEEVEEEEQIEEEEEIEEIEPVTTVSIKKSEKNSTPPPEVTETETDEGKAEVRDDISSESKEDTVNEKKEQVEEKEIKVKVEQDSEEKADNSVNKEQGTKIKEQEGQDEEIYEEAEETATEKGNKTENQKKPDVEENGAKEELSTEQVVSEKVIPIETEITQEEQSKTEIMEQKSETNIDEKQDIQHEKSEQKPQIEMKIPLREPSIPLEKIEDIEIKPIAPAGVVTKTHTEKTEIITSSSDQPSGVHSTQTEYNRIENIVTVNRTTKTLDNTYENLAQNDVPTVKTYFTPSRILSSPMPTSPYQPVYPPVLTERRHSLLLDRLSVDRQMPSEIYHNQNYEQQGQLTQEPQSEVLTISNIKPSKITNQQWYQQSKESVPNNVTSTPLPSEAPSWTQPKAQPQTTYKPQPTYQPPQSYQTQPTYQSQQSYQPQPTYQPQQTYQTQQSFPPQQTYPPQPTPQSQYQPSYVDPVQTNKYSTFTPKPVNRVSSLDTTPSLNASSNLYSFNNDSSEIYQKSTQQYSSSYVPPPWEQDSSYIADSNQNYYQSSTTGTINTTPTPAQSWTATLPKGKFSKPPPTAYIPPAPNQSFVKPVSNAEPSKQSGRKTYYSEYERRYISVPESTYIPHETKFQPQPDPSPKYYYDNTETNETVEHQWRKELREFTEKTSQTQSEQATVKPPWESDPKYTKTTDQPYTPTPTWSQTVRPRSWRERSFESEFVGSQEWPKTNTLGRGRPLHSYNINEPISERPRGVSVDRYNPNSYKPVTSLEHPPVQTHTLPTPAPHGTYHNPNVPAYHSRASDEIR